MSSEALGRRFAPAARMLMPLVFGGWAAAIALVPDLAGKAILGAPAMLVPITWWTVSRPGRWLLAFFGAALLLPPLPIPIGDSGPHPSLLFALLGIFAGLVWLRDWRVELSGT